jgi:hypothetical protein
VLAANGVLAALRDGILAVLDVARFPANGKNRTALRQLRELPGGTVVGFCWSDGAGCATASASPLLD